MNNQILQPRWKIWEGLLAIIIIVLLMFGIGFLASFGSELWQLDDLKVSFFGGLLQTFLMVGAVWYFTVVKYNYSFRALGFKKKGLISALPKGIKWGIGLFFLVMVLGIVMAILYPSEPDLQDFAKILLMVDTPGKLFLVVIMGVVLAPIGEEIYFRGFLYPAIRKRFGVLGGIIITSVCFSALHFDLFRLIPIALGGVGLTYLYEKTANIWTNILAHGVWNGITIALFFLATPI